VNNIFRQNLKNVGVLGMSTCSVKVFLNRLLGVEPRQQNILFEYFEKTMQALVLKAKQEGKYDEGFEDIRGRNVELMQTSVFYSNKASRIAVIHSQIMVDRGISWEEVQDMYSKCQETVDGIASSINDVKPEENKYESEQSVNDTTPQVNDNENIGHINESIPLADIEELKSNANVADEEKKIFAQFYISKGKLFGAYQYILVTHDYNSKSFVITRPNTGCMSRDYTGMDEILRKYSPIAPDKAEMGWRRIFSDSKTHCIHWTGCKLGTLCRVGMRLMPYNILSGSLLPIWGVLERLSLECEGVSVGDTKILRIVRILLGENARLVGLNLPGEYIEHLKSLLPSATQASIVPDSSSSNTMDAKITTENVAPVDDKAKTGLSKPKANILSFFTPLSSAKNNIIPQQTQVSKQTATPSKRKSPNTSANMKTFFASSSSSTPTSKKKKVFVEDNGTREVIPSVEVIEIFSD